jgi:hypothetical protein
MVIHFEMEHYAPPVIMVEGAVVMVSWMAFVSWYSLAKCATCVYGNFAPVAIYGLPS